MTIPTVPCPDCHNGAFAPSSTCEQCGGYGEVCPDCKAPPSECICDPDWEEFDDDDDGEPIGSCDKCGTNLYRDDCYIVDGLEVCGQCYWWMTEAPKL